MNILDYASAHFGPRSRPVRFIGILCFLLAPFLIGTARSQNLPTDLTELEIEELMKIDVDSVVSASKHTQKTTEAPSSVTVVTADQIRKYGYRTLADILRSVRGFFVTYDRNYAYAGVRGFAGNDDYSSHLLILVDGHRVNDIVSDANYIGTDFPVDVDLIERVEVIRGPSSSLYGGNAFFGVVNVITKQGRDLKGFELSGDGGSFGTWKGTASYGNKFKNGLEVLFSGSYYDSRGHHQLYFKEFDRPATSFGTADNRDADRSYGLFSKISFQDFTLEGVFRHREKDIPTGSFDTVFNSPKNRSIDERGFLDLKYEHSFPGRWDAMARLHYDYSAYYGDYLYDVPPLTLNKDEIIGESWGVEIKVTKELLKNHLVTAGGEFRDKFRQGQKNYDLFPYVAYTDDTLKSTVWALYLQDEFTLLKNLAVNVGLRHDQYSTVGGTTNPRFALIYHPFEKTAVKLLYGKAFRPPNVMELYYQDSSWSKVNPSVNPETIQTLELAWEQGIGSHLRGSVSAYYYRMKDLITQVEDPKDGLFVYRNLGKIQAGGIELELSGRWASGLEGRISYSYQKTKDMETHTPLPNSPEHLGKLNVIVPLIREKLFLGLEEQYTGKRKTLAGREAAGFLVTNLTLFSQRLLKGLELSGSVYNLFNKRYGDPVSAEFRQDILPQDGRTFRLKATYRF
jgi:outer membrane receptor for ferrienterochelin and colicins